MVGLLLILLVAWIVVAILGLVIHGLFWLFIIGLVLFLGTAAWGWVKRRT